MGTLGACARVRKNGWGGGEGAVARPLPFRDFRLGADSEDLREDVRLNNATTSSGRSSFNAPGACLLVRVRRTRRVLELSPGLLLGAAILIGAKTRM